MKKVTILGSTGSIGVQTLNVIERLKETFSVHALVAGTNDNLLYSQVQKFKPSYCALSCEEAAKRFERHPQTSAASVKLIAAEEALTSDALFECDVIVVAIAGFSAINAVIKAIKLSKKIALATKEVLVAAGDIIMPMAKSYGAQIIPVDSEHSAIFQALDFDYEKPFKRLILTASGGPFVDKSLKELQNVTLHDALKHPNWQMGSKITVDSATMMNKGLEVIEAMHLYGCALDKVSAVIHRQSIVHSMVEFEDNSLIAQLGLPSMEIPIQLALTFPQRSYSGVEALDFEKFINLTFEKIDKEKFPCYKIALDAAALGGNMTCAMNTANEEAVALFLQGALPFTSIPVIIARVLEKIEFMGRPDLEDILYTDHKTRQIFKNALKGNSLYADL